MFSRENISMIVLLLDIRHKPTYDDKMMYEYIRGTNKPYIIIASKADKIAVTKVDDEVARIKEQLNLRDDEAVVPFSAERKIYTEDVWNNIYKWS